MGSPFKSPLKLSNVDSRPCLIDDDNQVVALGVWSQVSADAVAEDVRLLGDIRDLVNAHAGLVAAAKRYRDECVEQIAIADGDQIMTSAYSRDIAAIDKALADPAMDAVCEGLAKDAGLGLTE